MDIGAAHSAGMDREVRQYLLVRRLLLHQARPQTICRFTGWSRHRLVTVRKRWRQDGIRHRGTSPYSLVRLFRSPRIRREGASIAVLCELLHAVPSTPDACATHSLYSLEAGERLCDVYETYRACVPDSQFEFERLVMLAVALAKGEEVQLGHCQHCRAAILIDRLSTQRQLCSLCRADGPAVEHQRPPQTRVRAAEIASFAFTRGRVSNTP